MIFFYKQKTAYEIMPSLVGSKMCIRNRRRPERRPLVGRDFDGWGIDRRRLRHGRVFAGAASTGGKTNDAGAYDREKSRHQ